MSRRNIWELILNDLSGFLTKSNTWIIDLPFGMEKILKSKHNLCVCNVEAGLYVEVYSGPKICTWPKSLLTQTWHAWIFIFFNKYPTRDDPIKLDRVLHDPMAFIF